MNLVRLGIKHGIGFLANAKKPAGLVSIKILTKKMDLVAGEFLERFEFRRISDVRNFPFLMGQGNWFGSENLNQTTLFVMLLNTVLSVLAYYWPCRMFRRYDVANIMVRTKFGKRRLAETSMLRLKKIIVRIFRIIVDTLF